MSQGFHNCDLRLQRVCTPRDASSAINSVFTVASLLATITAARQPALRPMRNGSNLLFPECYLQTLARCHRKHFIGTLRPLGGWPEVAEGIRTMAGGESCYLICGDRSLRVLCFPVSANLLARPPVQNLPECEGALILCSEYKLHTDRYLSEELGVSFGGAQGTYAQISLHGKCCAISMHAMSRFRSRVAKSARLFELYGLSLLTERGVLVALARELRQARPAKRKNSVTQLMRHNYREAQYLSSHNWIYVLVADTIVTCYDKSELMTGLYEVSGADGISNLSRLTESA